ncbi:energy conserving hydrogenase B integral membrane subunit [Methanococcus vannielii SB]|uniref:Energy conserving hydrogenase B integral membrane subunit n=1 Tax=Methanococcus vannielii (strain ATCC 35089 / DSM 1224 / JCM 13029 / OCM 148 / SB) TaxID=406327 RepID=A6UQR2_METVS|nr:NADH-quinone oxidoreductase subunit H [Methanococcus vannielii]ABR54834.1 energy conserving hydrogenase B integral membrane subunit [Methanococcus vannielii SB]
MFESILTLESFEIILSIMGVPLIAFAISTWIPGIQRKIQARIQQRKGPSISSPGFWAIFKYLAKETKEPVSKLPKLYKFLPVLSFAVLWSILALTTVIKFHILPNEITIIGLLKIEEMVYIIMGSLASTVMGIRMPIEDECKGSSFIGQIKMTLEQLSAVRAFKLITIGSFPFYLATILPFIPHKSIFLSHLVGNNFLFTLGGLFGAITYIIGYIIMTKDYPFSIMHTKADVLEGPTMEYSGKYRALYLSVKELMMITLGSLFATLYLGIAPDILNPITIVLNFSVALIFPIISAIVSAYTPVFTFRQIYPVSLFATVLGIIGALLALIGI